MTDNPDAHVLICGDADVADAIPGSAVALCHDCRHPITIAPSGQALVAAGAIAVCLACGRRLAAVDPDPDITPIVSPEQAAEIARHLRDTRN